MDIIALIAWWICFSLFIVTFDTTWGELGYEEPIQSSSAKIQGCSGYEW